MSVLTYPEAVGVGLLQGVTELFPVSSLGHSILIPALLGGQWKQDLNISGEGSLYLNELVGLHLATALALVVYFWRDWIRVIRGLLSSITQRRSAGVSPGAEPGRPGRVSLPCPPPRSPGRPRC